jgi:hypothetical protein
MTVHAGIGGEIGIAGGLGVGVEIGAVGTRQQFASSVIGILSPNAYYHFAHSRTAALDPFVTGGYTLAFRAGHVNLFNVGAGMNFWFLRHLGFRLEGRDHIRPDGPLHYSGIRFGLAFR